MDGYLDVGDTLSPSDPTKKRKMGLADPPSVTPATPSVQSAPVPQASGIASPVAPLAPAVQPVNTASPPVPALSPAKALASPATSQMGTAYTAPPPPPTLGANYANAIKGSEGYTPQAAWDYKQNSNGYGTKARFAGEVIDQPEADRRFTNEIGDAYSRVHAFAPNAPEGAKAALASLTYNAGDDWMRAGLGNAVQSGDWATAKSKFLEYNKAGGQIVPGLANRRTQEAAWFDTGQPSPTPPQQAAKPGMQKPMALGLADTPPSDAMIGQWNQQAQAARDRANQSISYKGPMTWVNAVGSVLNTGVAQQYSDKATKGLADRQTNAGQLMAELNTPSGGAQPPPPNAAASGFAPTRTMDAPSSASTAQSTAQVGGAATLPATGLASAPPTATPSAGLASAPAAPPPVLAQTGLAATIPPASATTAPPLNSPRPNFAQTPDVLATAEETRKEGVLAKMMASGDPNLTKFAEAQLGAINQKKLSFGLQSQSAQQARQLQVEGKIQDQVISIRDRMAQGFIEPAEGQSQIAALQGMVGGGGSPSAPPSPTSAAQPQGVPPGAMPATGASSSAAASAFVPSSPSGIAPGQGGIVGTPRTPNEFQNVLASMPPDQRQAIKLAIASGDHKKAAEIMAGYKSPAQMGAEEFGKKAGETWAQAYQGHKTAANTARSMETTLGQFERALDTADKQGWSSGGLSSIAGSAGNMLQSAGINPQYLGLPNGQNLSQIELMKSLGSQLTANMAKSLQQGDGGGKSGSAARVTDADIKLFSASEPTLEHSPQGNRLLIQMLRERNQIQFSLGDAAKAAQQMHPNDPEAAQNAFEKFEEHVYGEYEKHRNTAIAQAGFGVKNGQIVPHEGDQPQARVAAPDIVNRLRSNISSTRTQEEKDAHIQAYDKRFGSGAAAKALAVPYNDIHQGVGDFFGGTTR